MDFLLVRVGVAPLICAPTCSKILFSSFGASPGLATTSHNAKNRQPYQNLHFLYARTLVSSFAQVTYEAG
jgi:hypothetical protein